ncbi:MAG: WHG domain-containing protein [Acidimicrobiales bacterium]|jgi:AcrR family transcriptional regulator|nr:WHG domain-containing protein [Acidimicrobiales bacterium]
MAAPVGLDRAAVVDAAVALVDDAGRVDAVRLHQVADRLGVRTQSLYAHVDGLDDLRRAVAVVALDRLAGSLAEAAAGRSGPDALAGIVRAYAGFALAHPGLYDATLLPPGDDPALGAAMASVGRPLNLVFRSYGLDDADALHWYRIVFASVHGFSLMRRDGLLTMPADPDETVERMIAVFVRELAAVAGDVGADPVTPDVRART